jgi:hypothetical protein
MYELPGANLTLDNIETMFSEVRNKGKAEHSPNS